MWGHGDYLWSWLGTLDYSAWTAHTWCLVGIGRGIPLERWPLLQHEVVLVVRKKHEEPVFDLELFAGLDLRIASNGLPFSFQRGLLYRSQRFPHQKGLRAVGISLGYIKPGGKVYDPCAGSGTTILAAEKWGRVALGVELCPEKCALTLARWVDATGQQPRLAGGVA